MRKRTALFRLSALVLSAFCAGVAASEPVEQPAAAVYPPPPGYYRLPSSSSEAPDEAALRAELQQLRAAMTRQQAALDRAGRQLQQARSELRQTQAEARVRDLACVNRVGQLTDALAGIRQLESRLQTLEQTAADIDLGALETAPAESTPAAASAPAEQLPTTQPSTDRESAITAADSAQLTGQSPGPVPPVPPAPAVPTGTAAHVTAPEPDRDADGIGDSSDLCPSSAGDAVDATGCLPAQTLVLEGVNFRYDSHTLTAAARRVLDRIIAVLRQHPGIKLEVAGHSDAQGNPVYNQWLSQLRANNVRDYMVEHGISATDLRARGYGATQPVAGNDTRAGLRSNRRVELRRLP